MGQKHRHKMQNYKTPRRKYKEIIIGQLFGNGFRDKIPKV